MIISMKLHATRQEIDEVRNQVEHFGYKVHSIEGEERVVIGVVGVGGRYGVHGVRQVHAAGGESGAHLRAVQICEQRISLGEDAGAREWHGNRRR